MFESPIQLAASIFFGIVGMGAFWLAKINHEETGIRKIFASVLMAYPYFVSNPWAFWITGVIFTIGSLYPWE